MAADIHGDPDGEVAQQFLDRLGMHALREQQSSGDVAQIMKPNPRTRAPSQSRVKIRSTRRCSKGSL